MESEGAARWLVASSASYRLPFSRVVTNISLVIGRRDTGDLPFQDISWEGRARGDASVNQGSELVMII